MNTDRLRIQSAFSFRSEGGRTSQEDCAVQVKERGIFAVADGFGSGGSGLASASLACASVREFLEREAGDLDATLPFVLRSYYTLAGNVIFNSMVHANEKLRHRNDALAPNARGGASVCASFIDGDILAVANVGVCSAWLVREGRLLELAPSQVYAKMWEPFAEDAAIDQAIPLAALGIAKDLEPTISEVRIRPGDWVLLQTDGLSSVDRAAIAALQAELGGASPLEALNRLFEGFQFRENAACSICIL